MELFEQQARNRRKTILLLAAFVLLVATVGGAMDYHDVLAAGLDGRPTQERLGPPLFTTGALLFSVAGGMFSYFRGDAMVLASMRARPANLDNPGERQLHNVVEEMAIASGLPMPRLFVVPDPDPNAFATGRSPEHASLGVTEGLLEVLDREELQAVVAHEIGHIANLDIRTMMIVTVLLGTVALLADMLTRGSRASTSLNHRRKSGAPLLILIGLGAAALGRLLAMAVSRTREFEADRSAAEFTRNPLALARALAKIEGQLTPTRLASPGTAHLFIVDPRLSKLNDGQGALANLFASHPPMKARIARLKAMGYEASSHLA